jgi:hypothetical protein
LNLYSVLTKLVLDYISCATDIFTSIRFQLFRKSPSGFVLQFLHSVPELKTFLRLRWSWNFAFVMRELDLSCWFIISFFNPFSFRLNFLINGWDFNSGMRIMLVGHKLSFWTYLLGTLSHYMGQMIWPMHLCLKVYVRMLHEIWVIRF